MLQLLEPQQEAKLVKLRFLWYVPQFMAENLEAYGPFEPGDIAEIPEKAAQVLIDKERAEVLS
ncbi:MAG TPA: hypothetical protein VJH37_04035 [Candidatus Nanoarchaeia archaeon]|nr:hypothetical protein [Candidatus Nanoarchaeia archaeon]